MLTHDELMKTMLEDPAVKAEYDALAEEFALLDVILRAVNRRVLSRVLSEHHPLPAKTSVLTEHPTEDLNRRET